MAVVGDDRPAHGVVAVRQVRSQRDRERVTGGARRTAKHRAAPVPDGLDPGADAHDVVEDDLDHGRWLRENGSRRRIRPHEVRMSRGSGRQHERDDRDRRQNTLHIGSHSRGEW